MPYRLPNVSYPGVSGRKDYSKIRRVQPVTSMAYRRRNYNRSLRKLGKKLSVVIGEKKYFVNEVAPQNVLSTGQIASLTDVSQGDGDTQRDGDQLTMTSLQVNYFLSMPLVSLGDVTNYIRIIIFQYHPFASSVPGITDILLTADFRAPYAHDKRFDFNILADKTFVLTAQSATAPNSNAIKMNKFFIKTFKRRKIQFTAGGVNGTNKLYILYISDSTTTPHPSVSWYIKLNYKDN